MEIFGLRIPEITASAGSIRRELSRRLRKIDGTSGNITTIAGNGEGAFLGDNVPATTAVINYPLALAFDAAGNLFVGDSDNRVRKIDMVTRRITIVAGGGNPTDGIG